MKKQIFKFFTFFLLLLIISISANKVYSQGCQHQMQRHNDSSQFCCQRVIPDLTDDQKAKIKSLHQAFMTEMQGFKNSYNETLKKLGTAIKANNATEISNLTATLNDIKSKMLSAQITHIQSIRALLTPDQLAKFDAGNPFMNGNGCQGNNSQNCKQNCSQKKQCKRNCK